METTNCPCNSGKSYDDCCGPLISGSRGADSPEALMRSRYTAFCRRDIDYLVNTFAPEKRGLGEAETQLRNDLARTILQTRWLGLMVLDAGKDGLDRGFVEFAAFFMRRSMPGQDSGKNVGQLHERSDFILRNGSWYYLDGRILPPVSMGRNQPCFCGSGLKYKRCHGDSSGQGKG